MNGSCMVDCVKNGVGEGCKRGEGLIYDRRSERGSVSEGKNVWDISGNIREGRRGGGDFRNEEGEGILEIQEKEIRTEEEC